MDLARRRSRRLLAFGAVATLIAALGLAGALAWRAASGASRVRLNQIGLPTLSTGPCPGLAATSPAGPAVSVVTEWIIRADPVGVLNALTRRGWMAATRMTTVMELLPTRATVVELGVAQLQVYRGVSLSYTDDRSTRLVSSFSLVLCPI